jgi:hypothetical protein
MGFLGGPDFGGLGQGPIQQIGGAGGYDIIQFVLSLFGAILNWVKAVVLAIIGVLQAIAGLFVHIWNNFFKGLFRGLLDKLKKSQIWNDLKHGHILQFLHDLRALLDSLFLSYIKPILDLLQHVRQFLLILRVLHVQFAQKLDNLLAQIQGDIAKEFLLIRGAVNNVIDLANILQDPSLLLRKPTLIASLRRILPALSVVLTRRPLGYWFPSPRAHPSPGQAPVPIPSGPGTAPTFPLASSFLGEDDGLAAFPFPQLGFVSTASAVDDIDALDFFIDELYPAPQCADPVKCLIPLLRVSSNG